MKAPRSGRARLLTAVVSVAVVGAAVAGYLALTAGTATAKQFATLTVLEGTVEVHEAGTPGFRPGTTGDTLRQGDIVRTGDDGRADIEFFDGSVTRLDVGTELRLKELASVPDVPDSKTIVSDQSSGKTLNRVVELTDSESRFETETPSAVASVRGTEYVTIVYPNGASEHWVLSGTLIILLADGSTIELNAGQGVFVDALGNAGEIFEITDADVEALCDLDPEFCPDEVQDVEIEEEEEGDDVQGTTVTREETDDDVTLIPPVVIIRDDPDDGDNDPPQTTIQSGPDSVSNERHAEFVVQSDEPNSTFECSLDGGEHEAGFGPCPTPVAASSRQTQATGTTSLTVVYSDLVDFDGYSFQVRATDAAGNTDNTPAGQGWDVSAPPETEILGDISVDGDTATVLLSSDEPGTFECSLEQAPEEDDYEPCAEDAGEVDLERVSALDAPATMTAVFEGLDDGTYTLHARAVDLTDQPDPTPATGEFTIDVPAPTPGPAVIDSGPTNGTTSTSATFTFHSDPAGATFTCSLDNATPTPCVSGITYTGLAQTSHLFQVQAFDGATPVGDPATWPWVIGSEAITINLLWDGPPSDLDLHLQGAGGPHVWYADKCEPNTAVGAGGVCTSAAWAALDRDVTNAGSGSPPQVGSETITLYPTRSGFQAITYAIYVINFNCSSASFAPSNARVRILGGGQDQTFSLAGASGALNAKQWNVGSITVAADGTASLASTQTLTGGTCGTLPSLTSQRRVSSAPASFTDIDPAGTARIEAGQTDGGGTKVAWEPDALDGEVRVSLDAFPDEITDGELGCRGIGHCVIEDVEPGTTLYLTVFPTGVTALDPVEDVTSIRVEIPPLPEPSPELEPDPAIENDPPPDGTPTEDPDPEPTPEPTPSPPPPAE